MLIEGQVWDVHTGCPLAGAEVSCTGPGGRVRAMSDGKGYFRLRLMDAGSWQVNVHRAPYREESIGGVLVRDKVFLTFDLQMEGLEDGPVTA